MSRPCRLLLAACLAVAGCGTGGYDSVELMPSPVLYRTEAFDPYAALAPDNLEEQTALLYVTDRKPVGDAGPPYADARGHLMRAGEAVVKADPAFRDWDEIRAATFEGRREHDYSLKLASAEEIGVLPAGVTAFHAEAPPAAVTEAAAAEFAARINRQLALSGTPDVFIYVPGYNVDFGYPLLVSKELQHFLGYRGAFIGFAWPATPSRFAYLRDLETTDATIRALRMLIEFLSSRTDARRVHVIGYSAGSRIAFGAAYRLAVEHAAAGDAGAEGRLGQLVLLGSDIDPVYFLQGIADGLLDVTDRVAVYMSGTDSALGMSRLVFSQRRLGEALSPEDLSPALERELAELDGLELIDVSFAAGADAGNGHHYFRSSPWVSSDVFLGLLSGRGAAERALVHEPGSAVWRFPADYPERLRRMLGEGERLTATAGRP